MPRATIFLQPGKTYGVKVRGINGNAIGPWSDTTYFTADTDTTAPEAPTNLTATAVPGGLQLKWTNPVAYDIEYCRIYVSTSSIPVGGDGRVTGLDPVANVDADAVAILGLSPGTYYARVEAVDRAGNRSQASVEVSFTVGESPISDARADYTTEEVDTAEEVAAVVNALGGKINELLAALRSQGVIGT